MEVWKIVAYRKFTFDLINMADHLKLRQGSGQDASSLEAAQRNLIGLDRVRSWFYKETKNESRTQQLIKELKEKL